MGDCHVASLLAMTRFSFMPWDTDIFIRDFQPLGIDNCTQELYNV